MRLLHAGHDPRFETDYRPQSASHRRGNPHGPRRKCVPLHRLSAHRERGAGRGREGGSIIMATTIAKPELLVGKRLRRREDPRLITGTATYVDDMKMPGMLHAVIVRSPHAAASIKSMDISKAAAHQGVAAVFTGKDTEKVGPVPCGASLPGLGGAHHYI